MSSQIELSKNRNRTLKTNGRNHVPLPTGEYQKVGCRDFMVGLSRKSGILVRLYYPAKFDKNKLNEINPFLWPNWLPHEFYKQGIYDDVFKKRKIIPLIGINIKNVFIPCIPNAKPHVLSNGEKYPVIVVSHGLGDCRTSLSSICIEFASQGFVVVALEHRDNSACLTFYPKRATYSFKNSNPDFFNIPMDEVDANDEVDFGDEIDDPNYVPPKALAALTNIPHLELAWIRYRYVPLSRTDTNVLEFRKKQINHRVRECTRALDLIEALNAGYEINNLLDPAYNYREFENMFDMDRIIMMGHTMGGSTALMAGAAELRFKVIIALNPWLFPINDESLDLIPQPVLMIFSENIEKWIPKLKDNVDNRKAIVINGSNSLQQSDAPYVFRNLKWHSWFKMDSIIVHDLTNYSSFQFISKHLGIPIEDRINRYLEEQKKKIRPLIK